MYRGWRNSLKEKIDEIRLKKFFQERAAHYPGDPDDLAVNGYKIFGSDSEKFDQEDLQEMFESLRSRLRLTGSENLLEIGCGSGLLSQALAGFCSQYIGIDISANMVALAQKKNIPQAQFYCMNGRKLKFPDDTFRRVLAYFVFINLPHWHYCEQILAEMLRVVKKDHGLMLIGNLPDAEAPLPITKPPSLDQDQPRINLFRHLSGLLAPDVSIKHFNKSLFLEWGRKQGLTTEIVQSAVGKYSLHRFDVIYSFP